LMLCRRDYLQRVLCGSANRTMESFLDADTDEDQDETDNDKRTVPRVLLFT